jgi:gluconate 2-dehydrogenase gamma chain
MHQKASQRRDFIKKSIIGVGGFIFLQRCSIETSRWKFLTNKEGALLEAIAEQFIPEDEDPGAREACVVNFIDTQLTKHYKRFQDRYRTGLKALQKTCSMVTGSEFEKLASAEQLTFLEQMEDNKLPEDHWASEDPSSFFRLMLSHCMQGFYGDPRHGGNCNHVSYNMIDLRVIQFYQPAINEAI